MLNNNMLNVFPISASADYADRSFAVSVKPIEISGDTIGINNEIEGDALKGKFRLMNGNIYRVIDEEPPVSDLLKLSEQAGMKKEDVSA